MAPLKRSSLLALACGIVMLMFGARYITCAVLTLLVFLFSGGWKWVLLVVRTLPRDLR